MWAIVLGFFCFFIKRKLFTLWNFFTLSSLPGLLKFNILFLIISLVLIGIIPNSGFTGLNNIYILYMCVCVCVCVCVWFLCLMAYQLFLGMQGRTQVIYSYGPPHMAVQKHDDQHEHTFSNYVRIQDAVQKTCLRRWTIGKSGERGSGISVLPARYDEDDNDECRSHSPRRTVVVLSNP